MKTLLLMRHAKSSWEATDDSGAPLGDHDRPLNRRGHRAAPRMGRLMQEQGWAPDLVIGSSAQRVKQTLDHALPAAGYLGEVLLTPRIYLSGAEAYVSVIRRIGSQLLVSRLDESNAEEEPTSAKIRLHEAQTLLVVGHNPDIEDLITECSGAQERMPTAALAVLNCPVESWREFDGGGCELVQVYRPRELDASVPA
ncbi:MAG: histidine phosphatase family protein [Myxococcales bacterium]|nr:histidine phosphatase family protein [Myxococcales bacterium]